MTTITAAVTEAGGAPFTLQDVELGALQDHEILVDIKAVGLCHTDLTVASGALPFPLPGVLGHEGAGLVRQVGAAVTSVTPGDRVVLSFTSCGHCEGCRGGHPAYCVRWLPDNLLGGQRVDGSSPLTRAGKAIGGHFFAQSSFATAAIAEERNVVKVSTDLPWEQLAPLACGVQTGAGAVWNALQPGPGHSLVVFGVGTVGLAAVIAAALSPATRIVAVDLVDERLELARELGATHTINPSRVEDVVASIQEATGGGAHGVVEATGNTKVLEQAVQCTRGQGEVAIVGAPPFGQSVQVDVNFMLPGRKIHGLTIGDAEIQSLVPAILALAEQGRFPVERLVRAYPLADINTAVEDMSAGRTIKPVLLP
ncbi:NAD(P)-dependent alcohol dehydrogenase [Citricoccus nitrophenolicus]